MKQFLLILVYLQIGFIGFIYGSVPESIGRYQEPKLPYPYDHEEVIFHNSSDNVTLAGTLTLPRSKGPVPAVILIQGSSPLNRNAALFGHKLFLVWADHLTRLGIAVLRFDKRSAGQSTGDYHSSSIENFAGDVLAGIEYLKTRKEINHKQIGLIGHSEGGSTASLAAVQSKDVVFVVLMASAGVNWEELVPRQEESLMRLDGVPEEFIGRSLEFRKQLFEIMKNNDRKIAEPKIREVFTKYFDRCLPEEKSFAENYYGPLEAKVQCHNSVWFRYNLVYDPAETLKRIEVPILALNGELDFVVSPEQNLTRIAKTLETAKHENYKIVEVPSVNHMFQTCKTGSVREYAEIEETTAPVVLHIMSDWILQRCSR